MSIGEFIFNVVRWLPWQPQEYLLCLPLWTFRTWETWIGCGTWGDSLINRRGGEGLGEQRALQR